MATNNLLNTPFPLSAAKGGLGVASPSAHGILVAEGSSAVTPIVLTNGQVLIGSTGADPVGATLTAGTGVSIVNAAGSVTISATSQGFATVNQTSATVTMAVDTQYINSGTANSQVTYTIPATVAQGQAFRIMGVSTNTGGWVLQANTGQTVYVGNTATTAGGTVTFADKLDNITIVCVVANTDFVVVSGATAGLTTA